MVEHYYILKLQPESLEELAIGVANIIYVGGIVALFLALFGPLFFGSSF
jgi:hypothetical protein